MSHRNRYLGFVYRSFEYNSVSQKLKKVSRDTSFSVNTVLRKSKVRFTYRILVRLRGGSVVSCASSSTGMACLTAFQNTPGFVLCLTSYEATKMELEQILINVPH